MEYYNIHIQREREPESWYIQRTNEENTIDLALRVSIT